MRVTRLPCGFLVLIVLVASAGLAQAEVRLPSIFSDHMVLQQDMPVPVWGWADPGEKVTVEIAGQQKSATADNDGRWSLKLEALKPAEPTTLRVRGGNTIEISDVLVGEVWLCSGQSNMAWTVSQAKDFEEEQKAAELPQIRMFTAERTPAETPQTDVRGQWVVCSPETVGQFSATGYFFGRRLHKELKVPVGLINSSWGGTPVQAWTSIEAHQATPELRPLVIALEEQIAKWDSAEAKERFEKQLAKWKEVAAKAKKGGEQAPKRPQPPLDPHLSQHSPARLYNGMITPLAPFAIRGAIWYQGESNAGNAPLYGVQLRTMIANWRKLWQQGEFAFLYVQLPNFMAAQQAPSETAGWPIIREQFLETLEYPNTGMAVGIDVGEADNIHPKDKQTIGWRLAQWALAKFYGKDMPASGPLYRSMTKRDGKIVIEFNHVAGGLKAKGDKLEGFAIAGPNQYFHWADAVIEGDTVVVSSPEVADPVAVRYAWANNPKANLYNQAELPASPFRTDDWEN
ncbi:MAG: sialate O-acetylesterase [Planctomycetota bacterium]